MSDKPPISLKISGVEAFEKNIKELPDIIQKRVVLGGFREGARIVEKRAQELAPRGIEPAKGKRLWETIKILRPSRKQLIENREIIYSVRTRHPLAVLAEYGSELRHRIKSGGSTGRMPMFAFMRRAVDETGESAINAIAAKCKDLLERALSRLPKR